MKGTYAKTNRTTTTKTTGKKNGKGKKRKRERKVNKLRVVLIFQNLMIYCHSKKEGLTKLATETYKQNCQ